MIIQRNMYDYKFVKVSLTGLFTSKPKKDYKEIIVTHAKEGWRFVQLFAPATTGYGRAFYFELIFEKRKEE